MTLRLEQSTVASAAAVELRCCPIHPEISLDLSNRSTCNPMPYGKRGNGGGIVIIRYDTVMMIIGIGLGWMVVAV